MTRLELKTRAKQILTNNYWLIVGTVFLYTLLVSAVSGIPTVGTAAIFFIQPIMLGLYCNLVAFSDGQKPQIGDMFTEGFNSKYYLRRVGGMAWMSLFIFLWSLLFIIPGIIKAYSYTMTPYILAKYPEIPAKEALKLSMKIMNGRKMEFFILQLSFVGWAILSGLTFGLLAIFYVVPYIMITEVLWFKNVMNTVTDSGEFVYTAQPTLEA